MNVAFKKKKSAHAYLLYRSLLAGKSATVEQMLLTESIKKKKWCIRIESAWFFLAEKLNRWKGLNKVDYSA